MSFLLNVSGVSKSFPGFSLKPVSFTLEPGYIMGLIGENGAGKTTLLHLINGLYTYTDTQDVFVNGFSMKEQPVEAKSLIGFVFEKNPFLDTATPLGLSYAYGPYYPEWNQSDFLKLCRDFNLDYTQPFKKLSAGNGIKFQLAFALAHHPRLLILDEPAANLDPVFRRDFYRILTDFIASGENSVLLSTHIVEEMEPFTDYVSLLHNGELLFSASMEELLEQYLLIKGSPLQISAFKSRLVGSTAHEHFTEALIINPKEPVKIPVTVNRPTLYDIMHYLPGINERRPSL